MENQNDVAKEYALGTVITKAVQLPGVKVNRREFLTKTFASDTNRITDIVDNGPIAANYTQEELSKISHKLILQRTSESSAVSFAAGIPGGVAMVATIPADVLQFFGMTLRLAQELSYIYGAQDLWENGEVDDEKVRNQLIVYCGVMFGVSGAVSGLHILANQLAKTTLKKLPQKALTKTFWYPIVKQIGKAIGIKVTKTTVAQGISKAIPIVGGVISGGLNFASMLPMANRLQKALDEANFNYTDADLEQDIIDIENYTVDEEVDSSEDKVSVKDKVSSGIKNVGNGITDFISKHSSNKKSSNIQSEKNDDDIFNSIERLAKLKDMGAITQEEFDEKKKCLLSKLQ
ncbi:MAG: SHOCT domain-containing protein [Oscillospiraceae bacterium]|nr:SHOCT domain-containing protein [Oscillospiraceae bacterium]